MSRKPYECFKCRDSGFPNTMIYLAGKDEQGRTIQLEEDGTKHVHKIKGQEQQHGSSNIVTTVTTEPTLLKIIDAKLDRLIALLQESRK